MGGARPVPAIPTAVPATFGAVTAPPAAASHVAPALLAGRYRVLESLGTGGSGTVFRAAHEVTEQVSAIKLLNVEASQDPHWRVRFEREARTLARLEHPGIVQLRDFGEQDTRLFLVMEYCPGGSMAQLIATRGSIPAAEALSLLISVAEALQYAHGKGVIHRDLKPANLLFSAHCEVKVGDFGLAHLRDADIHSTVGLAVGTPHYMAPEQIMGETVDERTDVYALGAILHEMLTTRPPYEGGSAFAIQEQHLKAPPPSLRCHIPGVSMQLEGIVSRAMAKRKDARYPNCDALADAAREALGSPSSIHSGVGRVVLPDNGSVLGTSSRRSAVASTLAPATPSLTMSSRSARDPALAMAGFEFCRNQADSFQRLTALQYRATSHIKATRFSDRAIQDRARYWQAVVDRAHDPEITYYRLTSVRSPQALRSVLDIVDQMTMSRNFWLAITRATHPFEIILRDGEEVVFCFHKGDFVVYASLAFDGEQDPSAQRIVALYEGMFDEMWDEADMCVNFRGQIAGDPKRALDVKKAIRDHFREYDES